MVFPLVVEDDVNLLGAWSADVGSEHEEVWSVAVHLFGLKGAVKQLHVAPTAVNILLVLHTELNHQRLLLIRKLVELCRQRVEVSVLGRLDS
jgi:hypothetical protein